MHKKLPILLICFFLFIPKPSHAADDSSRLETLKPAEQVVVVQKKIEEERKPKPEPAYKEPEIKIEAEVPVKEALPGISLFVRRIQLEGNTVFTSEELKPLVELYENKEATFEKLKELTQTISQRYREKGFRTSFAYIPRQQIKDEVVRIAIVEGKVGNILFKGDRFSRKKTLRAYIKIKPGEILNVKRIEAALRHLNEVLDREVEARLVAGEKPKTSDIIFEVKGEFPIHGSFRYDNEGVKSSGQQRYHFMLRDQNTTGFDDALSIGTIFGQHFGFIVSQYELPFPKTDTKLFTGFSYGQSTPKGDLRAFGVNSTSRLYSAGIEQNLIRRAHVSMKMSGGFEFLDSRTLVLAGTFTRERLRIFNLRHKIIIASSKFATVANSDFRFGVNGFGASIHADPSSSRQGAKPDFFVFKNRLLHFQDLPLDTDASIQIEFQHPTRKLPSQEALSLGGASTVRGYPEGDYLADTGFRYSVDYLIPFFLFPKDWQLPFSKTPLRKQVQVVTFVDEAYGRLRGPSSNEVRTRHLLGTGGGIRIRLYENIFARFEWAAAVGNEPLRNGNLHEFHFRIETEPIDALREIIRGAKPKNDG